MTRVIVLGSTGMLGSMVYGYLRRNPRLEVIGTDRTTFEAESFTSGATQVAELDADFIVNCIGVIKPYCRDDDAAGVRHAIVVNALFPHRLAQATKANGARLIQIATDCVYSGAKGAYLESDAHDPLDVYGKTKSLGEVFDGTMLNIRCSIIGPEVRAKVSLLEWFLANPDGGELNGFAHHRWNGVTTLQFAQLCERIIASGAFEALRRQSHTHHFVPNDSLNKYELLSAMQRAYGKSVRIKRVDHIGPAVDRTLATKYGALRELFGRSSIAEALAELRRYAEGCDTLWTRTSGPSV
jgi:dTDP-4-dehydrorhamnose reductase